MGKLKIIYVFDPLCGWCFGFAGVMNRIRADYKDQFDFRIMSGGLVIGARVCKIAEKAPYLKKRLPDVERIAKVKFGQPFLDLLDEGEYISNSEPPSIAFNVFKSFRPDIAFELGHAIQEAHYLEGRDLNNIKTYFNIAEKFEINKFGFMERYQDPVFRQKTLGDFDLTRSWGIHNYPALVLKNQSATEPFMEGYSDYETVKSDLDDVLSEHIK